MPSPQEVYNESVRQLPPEQQLEIAALILQALTRPAPTPIDKSDVWTDEDVRDLTQYSLQHASLAYPDDEELV